MDTSLDSRPKCSLLKLDHHCDVEIWVERHAAAVRRIWPLADGRFVFILRHDLRQGVAGGTIDMAVLFDPATGTVTGTSWGRRFVEFVIECPEGH